jgi:hypothetical protein
MEGAKEPAPDPVDDEDDASAWLLSSEHKRRNWSLVALCTVLSVSSVVGAVVVGVVRLPASTLFCPASSWSLFCSVYVPFISACA